MAIIVDRTNVSFIVYQNRFVGSIQEIMPRGEFQSKFGVTFFEVDTVAYEPERKIFHIEREGRVDAFQSADQDPLMSQLQSVEDAVLEHFEMVCLEKMKPSQYHFLENKVWVITQEDQSKLDREAFKANFRKDRDALLVEADILINKAADLGQDTTALRTYRQALRDATVSWVMPTKP
jgi:vancomycin resistance protein YoaR